MKKFLLTLSTLPLLLAGTEWYVSNSGDDRNAGSAEHPLKTIGRAIGKAAPGDTVRLAPGIYREGNVIRKSGTKDKPLTIAGTRGAKGEYLSVIEAPGVLLNRWQPAPEVAPGVWKTPLEKRPDLMLMDGRMIAYINKLTMALPRWKKLPEAVDDAMISSSFGPGCKRLSGLDLLALPHDIRAKMGLLRDSRERLWEVLDDVLSGWRDGVLYVRLADGSKPETHLFTASYGNCFTLLNASYWNFRDLFVRGSRYQFFMQKNCTGNRIENSLLMHGGCRIRMEKGVCDTLIRNNIMTAGFIRGDLFKLRSREDMRGGLLYKVFKYIIGTSLSDDSSIIDRGTGSRIFDNIMMQGLVGIDSYGVNCEVAGNVIREMSSVGICTIDGCIGRFHSNLVMNCGILLRFHHFRHTRVKREEYHYRNLFYQAPHDGSMTFIHCESEKFADKVNFDPETGSYRKNPPDPVDGGKFYIYHNTFWGGDDRYIHFNTSYPSHKFNLTPLPFYFMNNIIKYVSRNSEKRWKRYSLEHQDALAGNLFFRVIDPPEWTAPEESGIARFNKVIEKAEYPKLWNGRSTCGLPDVTLSAESPAAGCGLDLTKPQNFNGKALPSLPGLEKMGSRPAAGALQVGESQQKFFEMYRKSEETAPMLRSLR